MLVESRWGMEVMGGEGWWEEVEAERDSEERKKIELVLMPKDQYERDVKNNRKVDIIFE